MKQERNITREFITLLREEGQDKLKCHVAGHPRRIRYIHNMTGGINGNPHDLWIYGPSQRHCIKRVYLGSPEIAAQGIDYLHGLAL